MNHREGMLVNCNLLLLFRINKISLFLLLSFSLFPLHPVFLIQPIPPVAFLIYLICSDHNSWYQSY